MNAVIRDRIEQMRRGEIPDGYKHTSIGLIPATWRVDKLEKHLDAHDELSNDTSNILVVTSSRGGLILQSEYYQQQRFEETRLGYHVVPRGYVTYRHMSDDDIFRFNVNNLADAVLVSPEYPVFTTKPTLLQSVLVDYLNASPRFLTFCRAQKKGSTRTRMYFSNLQQFTMPIPPVSEQRKIAELLAHCNKVIELKEQLIEGKRNQKKWLMQNLLNPNSGVKLPGFAGIWKPVRLNELCNMKSGDTITSESIDITGLYPCYGGNGFRGYTNTFTHQGAFVLIGRQGALCGNVLFVEGTFYASEHAIVARANDKTDIHFLFYLLERMELNRHSESSAQPGLAVDKVLKMKTTVPLMKDEQIAIANIFSAADSEIDLLEQELTQWQIKKKALMQLLLTGIARV